MLHIVVAHHHQLYHNESRKGGDEEHIELELRVLEQVLDLELDNCRIKQGEVHSREEAEEGADVFQRRRMEERCTAVVGGETTRSRSGHRIVETVEEIHSCHVIGGDAGDGEHQIDTPYPFCRGRESGMQLGLDRTRSLGGKHLGLSANERRQQGDGEEHDTQTAYPLGERSPEEQSVREAFHIIQDGGTRGGESRHRLEVGIRKVADVAAYHEGQGAEETEDNPG